MINSVTNTEKFNLRSSGINKHQFLDSVLFQYYKMTDKSS